MITVNTLLSLVRKNLAWTLLGIGSICQAQPPAASLSKYVDKFTGDLQYSVPLMTVPGPNGEQFPITLQYSSGGIGVDQAASEVGLGWSISTGEIVRKVNGRPDDVRAGEALTTTLTVQNISNVVDCSTAGPTVKNDLRAYGPVHFKTLPATNDATMNANCSTCASMDLYTSRNNMANDQTSFEFPDYDDYAITGPLYSGKLGLHLFEYSSIFYEPRLGETNTFTHDMASLTRATKRPVFVNYDAKELNINAPLGSRSYQQWQAESGLSFPFPDPTTAVTGEQGADLIDDVTPNRVRTGTQTRYFTNQEINAHYNGGAQIAGFMDWQLQTDYPQRNNSAAFPQDGIGAIQVFDVNGFTYHYSLPVHTLSEKRYVFDLEHDGTEFILTDPGTSYEKALEKTELLYSYATSWKLTAVTGPDFVDDGNGVVDQNDKGYWIKFDYAQWSNDFATRFPVFGFQADLTTESAFSNYFGALLVNAPATRKTGTCLEQHEELFYLNSISTKTHSALFIHDVRFDEHSVELTPKPRLKLTEVILIRNSSIPVAFNVNVDPSAGPFQPFGQSGAAIDHVHNTVQLEQSGLREQSLFSARFLHDYSLAKKSLTNINSGYASSLFESNNARNWCDVIYYDRPASITPINDAQSGKLTLKGIRTFGIGAVQTQPGIDYSYYDSMEMDDTSLDPLNSDTHRKDHFGHFKYDYDNFSGGGYTTERSARYLHAWSLKTIHDPLDGLLTINYEPDNYSLVGYGSTQGTPPVRIYQLRDLTPVQGAIGNKAWLLDRDAIHDLIDNDNIVSTSMYYYTNASTCQASVHQYRPVSLSYLESDNSTSEYLIRAQVLQTNQSSVDDCPVTSQISGHNNFIAAEFKNQYGGGVRVMSIQHTSLQNTDQKTLGFEYAEGVCTAEPDPFDDVSQGIAVNGQLTTERYITMDRGSGDRHAPPVMVGYSLVTEKVLDQNNQSAGGIEYAFGNYANTINFNRHNLFEELVGSSNYSAAQSEVVECSVGESLHGQLLNQRVIDKVGNPLSETIYRYESIPSSNIEEAFVRIGVAENFPIQTLITSTFAKSIKFRKLIAIEQHENSAVLKTTYENYDHLTGEPLKTRIVQVGVGEREFTKIPTYLEYTAMGPKCIDQNNANILTPIKQTASTDGTASRNAWSDTHVIRDYDPAIGDYTTASAVAQWAPTRAYTDLGNENWKYLGRPTLFDPAMKPLEQKNMADSYAATKISLSGEFAVAEVSNCNHASFTYASFDKAVLLPKTGGDPQLWFDGEVTSGDRTGITQQTSSQTVIPHSGTGTVRVAADSQGPFYHTKPSTVVDAGETLQTGLLTGRTYRAIVWVHQSSPGTAGLQLLLNGSYTLSATMNRDDPGALLVGDWVRLEVRLAVPVDFVASGTNDGLTVQLMNTNGQTEAYFDDLLLHPVDANVNTACWDEAKGLMIATAGTSGFITTYEHDPSGQVIEVHQENENGIRLVQKTEVGYKKPF